MLIPISLWLLNNKELLDGISMKCIPTVRYMIFYCIHNGTMALEINIVTMVNMIISEKLEMVFERASIVYALFGQLSPYLTNIADFMYRQTARLCCCVFKNTLLIGLSSRIKYHKTKASVRFNTNTCQPGRFFNYYNNRMT